MAQNKPNPAALSFGAWSLWPRPLRSRLLFRSCKSPVLGHSLKFREIFGPVMQGCRIGVRHDVESLSFFSLRERVEGGRVFA